MVTMFMVAVLIVMIGSAYTFTSHVRRNAQRVAIRQQALMVGDSALELLFAQFKDAVNNHPQSLGNLAPTRVEMEQYLANHIPTGAAFPELQADYFPNISVSSFKTSSLFGATTQTPVFTTYAIEPLNSLGVVSGTCEFARANGLDGKLEGKAYRFLATVDVQLPTPSGQMVRAHLSRVFEYQAKSFLNYAIFTNEDMEIHNGPPMTLTGAVHSNKNIYVGCGGQLTFTETVDAVGTIKVGKAPSDTNHGTTTVTPNGTGWPTNYLTDNLSKPNYSLKVTPMDIADSSISNADTNLNNDTYREMIEQLKSFPLATFPDPFSPADVRSDASQVFDAAHLETLRFANVADYIITIDNATHDVRLPADKASVTITDSDGNTYTAANNPTVFDAFLNGVTKNGTTIKPILELPSLTVDAAADAGNKALNSPYFKDFREGEKDTNADTAVYSDKYVPTVMQTTNVDVAALKAAADAGVVKTGGIGIYIQDKRAVAPLVSRVTRQVVTTSTNSRGKVTTTTTTVEDSKTIPKTAPAIRLKNGASLPSGGLTIVSPNPVYVQGDYNTGASYNPTTGALTKQPAAATATSTGWPDTGSYWDPYENALPKKAADPAYQSAHDPTTLTQSDSGASSADVVDFTDPHTAVTGKYYWQPSAIIADAVNVLSNAWTDTNSGKSLAASNTVVNAAFIAGNISTPTTAATIATTGYPSTAYSGGMENFPRFLENWSNVKFCYVGSMVILFESQQSTGVWGKNSVYSAPTRRWAYDKNFLTYGVPLVSAGGSAYGGAAGGGSKKSIAGGGSKAYERKQWIARIVQ